ncbi:MAG: LLM class flavin-dependent oxidoreductase [Dehalococcoidia bacterium]
MRFGHFLYHINPDPAREAQAIDEALAEARRAESLGYDSVWLAEHHFSGEVAYGDPAVFAAAIALQTSRIRIGFAVLEMALHHPVRVAIQTALLDHLSKGRLLVGVARGSTYDGFQYRGFGTSVQFGRDSLEEAEELLLKAWTEDNVEHQGRHWDVAFGTIRPRPYTKPHPPLLRACVTDESVAAMARIGRPIMIRTSTAARAGEQIALYADTMRAAGFDPAAVEAALDQLWVWRDVYVSDTDDHALAEFQPGFEDYERDMERLRARWSPPDQPMTTRPAHRLRDAAGAIDLATTEIFVGSPERIRDRVAELRDAGVRNLLMTHRGGVVPPEYGSRSMRLLSERVMPYV